MAACGEAVPDCLSLGNVFEEPGMKTVAVKDRPDIPPRGVCYQWFRGKCTREPCKFPHELGADPSQRLSQQKSGVTTPEEGDRPQIAPRGICYEWFRGKCSREQCKFPHQLTSPELPTGPSGQRLGRYQTRKNVHNAHRATMFRAWLLDHFGGDRLSTGSGVLDVAGGKSELAFQLVNLNRMACTCIDPRMTSFSHYIKRLKFGFYHRRSGWASYNTCEDTTARFPKHFRLFFEPELWEVKDSEGEAYFTKALARARGVSWTDKGLQAFEDAEDAEETGEASPTEGPGGETKDVDDSPETQGLRDREVTDWGVVQETLRNCSAVVGMHPDQAAEAIIDFGLANNKPFALVPCCTYAKEFPRRQVRGKWVRTYEQLVDYLQLKHPGIRKDVLPFGGKNIVLWFDPEQETPKPE